MYNNFVPDRPLEPKEEPYVIANCGHEVYEGEELFEFDGVTLCPDCMADKFEELTLHEKAALLGYTVSEVGGEHYDWLY